jgi:putative ABC transport system permease protein
MQTTGDPAAALPSLRQALASVNRELPLATSITLDALLANSLKLRRFNLLLLGSFALTALVLSVIGVYGLLAQGTAERQQEIGVRIALGARPADVLSMVMRQGLGPALLGVVLGLAAAAALTRLIEGMLYAVTPLDQPTFLAVALVMLVTAALACWVPARRATRIDPLLALRSD